MSKFIRLLWFVVVGMSVSVAWCDGNDGSGIYSNADATADYLRDRDAQEQKDEFAKEEQAYKDGEEQARLMELQSRIDELEQKQKEIERDRQLSPRTN